jgi:hypothetical protein
MRPNMPTGSAASRAELVDALIASYVSWREQSAAVTSTYERWSAARPEERSDAFHAYLAALDCEEHAAAAYRHLVEQAGA